MTNFHLYGDPLDFTPRKPLRFQTRSGSDAVLVAARGDDGGPLAHDVWVAQAHQFTALLNVDIDRLPASITFSLSPATGGTFPVGAQPQVTVQIGTDNVVISSAGVGGLSSVDVVDVVIRDDGITMRRAAAWDDGSSDTATQPSAAAAAVARSAVGAQSLGPARQRRTVLTVDGSGSMKAPGMVELLEQLLHVLWGVAQVVSPDAEPILQLSTARGGGLQASPAALVAALSEAPFSVGAPMTQPQQDGDDGTAYLVISDEVPVQVRTWRLGDQDSLQVIVLGDAALREHSPVMTALFGESVPTVEFVHQVLRSYPERTLRPEGTPS